MTSDSFVFYRSFFEAFSLMETNDGVAYLKLLFDYALNGEWHDLDKYSPAVRIALLSARPQIDANNRKRINGRKGGLAKGEHYNTSIGKAVDTLTGTTSIVITQSPSGELGVMKGHLTKELMSDD